MLGYLIRIWCYLKISVGDRCPIMYFCIWKRGATHPGESFGQWQVSTGWRPVGEDRTQLGKSARDRQNPKEASRQLLHNIETVPQPNWGPLSSVEGNTVVQILHQRYPKCALQKRKLAQLMFLLTKSCNFSPNTSVTPRQCVHAYKSV